MRLFKSDFGRFSAREAARRSRPHVRKETGSQAAGSLSGKNGSSGWLAGNRKRLFRQGKSVFFGVKFSSSPKRLFDMFRMRGLKRAAAAIRGNGCYSARLQAMGFR